MKAGRPAGRAARPAPAGRVYRGTRVAGGCVRTHPPPRCAPSPRPHPAAAASAWSGGGAPGTLSPRDAPAREVLGSLREFLSGAPGQARRWAGPPGRAGRCNGELRAIAPSRVRNTGGAEPQAAPLTRPGSHGTPRRSPHCTRRATQPFSGSGFRKEVKSLAAETRTGCRATPEAPSRRPGRQAGSEQAPGFGKIGKGEKDLGKMYFKKKERAEKSRGCQGGGRGVPPLAGDPEGLLGSEPPENRSSAC